MEAVLARARAWRRPRKPPGEPPPGPWWFDAALAVVNLVCFVICALGGAPGWAAFNGAFFCWNGRDAIRGWQWDRYNRWKGGR